MLDSFRPERVLFRPGGVNLRPCLCDVLMHASAQSLDFLARTKKSSFPNRKPTVSHPEFPDGNWIISCFLLRLSYYVVSKFVASRNSRVRSCSTENNEVKATYCRADPKASLSILAEIARLKTPEKMIALYTKYKANGLTRGEIRKQVAKQKPANAPIDLAFVDQFYNRIDQLDINKLSADQQTSLTLALEKLCSMASRKMMA